MTPSIDTLINTFSLFATVILSIFVLFGSFIIWNGFALRDRAEKDLDKIEERKTNIEEIKTRTEEKEKQIEKTKANVEEIERNTQALNTQAKSTLLTLEARLEQAERTYAKNLSLLSVLEQRINTYPKTQNYPQPHSALYGSQVFQPPSPQGLTINPSITATGVMGTASLTTTKVNGNGSLLVNQGTKINS